MGSLDGWSIVGILLVVAIAAWGVRLLKQRMDEQRYRQELADMEFEGSVFSELGPVVNNSQDLRFVNTSVEQTAVEQVATYPQAPQRMPDNPQITQPGQLPADEAAPYVLQQLQNASMFKAIEGYVDVHGNPKGAAILLLRDGKRALLVPHMESEAFLRRHSKRVEMIIMAGADGKGVVITPLEELISQNMLPR